MLLRQIHANVNSLACKGLVEISLAHFGTYAREISAGLKMEKKPGEFAALCVDMYGALSTSSISEIDESVEEIPKNRFDWLRAYLRTEHYKAKLIRSSSSLDYEDAVETVIADSMRRLPELKDKNIRQLYMETPIMRERLCVHFLSNRGSNMRLYKRQPSILLALQTDCVEYFRNVDFDSDREDAIVMPKVLTKYIDYYISEWAGKKLPGYRISNVAVSYEGDSISRYNLMNTDIVQSGNDIDLVDVMTRAARVSKEMFALKNAGLSGAETNLLYSVMEWFSSKKLADRLALINSYYLDSLSGREKVVPGAMSKTKGRKAFSLGANYGVRTALGMDSSVSRRLKSNQELLDYVDSLIPTYTRETAVSYRNLILRRINELSSDKNDSNYGYIRAADSIDVRRPAGDGQPVVSVLTDRGYGKYKDLIRCVCDMYNLDFALSKYGLSIVDMPGIRQLTPEYYGDYSTIEGLIYSVVVTGGRAAPELGDGIEVDGKDVFDGFPNSVVRKALQARENASAKNISKSSIATQKATLMKREPDPVESVMVKLEGLFSGSPFSNMNMAMYRAVAESVLVGDFLEGAYHVELPGEGDPTIRYMVKFFSRLDGQGLCRVLGAGAFMGFYAGALGVEAILPRLEGVGFDLERVRTVMGARYGEKSLALKEAYGTGRLAAVRYLQGVIAIMGYSVLDGLDTVRIAGTEYTISELSGLSLSETELRGFAGDGADLVGKLVLVMAGALECSRALAAKLGMEQETGFERALDTMLMASWYVTECNRALSCVFSVLDRLRFSEAVRKAATPAKKLTAERESQLCASEPDLQKWETWIKAVRFVGALRESGTSFAVRNALRDANLDHYLNTAMLTGDGADAYARGLCGIVTKAFQRLTCEEMQQTLFELHRISDAARKKSEEWLAVDSVKELSGLVDDFVFFQYKPQLLDAMRTEQYDMFSITGAVSRTEEFRRATDAMIEDVDGFYRYRSGAYATEEKQGRIWFYGKNGIMFGVEPETRDVKLTLYKKFRQLR